MTDHLIKTREVMKILGIARSTVYEWMAAGKLPPSVKLGRRGDNRWWLSSIEAMCPAKSQLSPEAGLNESATDRHGH